MVTVDIYNRGYLCQIRDINKYRKCSKTKTYGRNVNFMLNHNEKKQTNKKNKNKTKQNKNQNELQKNPLKKTNRLICLF